MTASPDSRHHLHELVDQLSDQQIAPAEQALETIRQNSLAAILHQIHGLHMPDHLAASLSRRGTP